MESQDIFAAFEHGRLESVEATVDCGRLPWHPHQSFPGVALKHLLTGEDTGGLFSYHLVRIDPGCSIGKHIHAGQLETHEVIGGSGRCDMDGKECRYHPGVIAVLPAGRPHSVAAGGDGLTLFAKFIPALL